MKIVELKTLAEQQSLYPLVKQMNPGITQAQFTSRLTAMRAGGYRCIAALEGKKLLGAAGFWTSTRFWCGKYIEADNVVVDKRYRSKGVGKKLMQWLDAEAKRLGCDSAWLLSYTHNHPSHRFYFRERYSIKGFVFVKEPD